MRLCHLLPLFALALAGCEQLGFEDPAKLAAQREADGKAIGSACRQSGRALEDCYSLYSKASKAAIFAGWQAMDGYMRENNISEVLPETVEPPAGRKPPAAQAAAPAEEKPPASDEAKPAPGEAKPGAEKKRPAKTGALATPAGQFKRMT